MRSLEKLESKARSLLEFYMDPGSDYSFTTYDVSPQNTSDSLRPEDILVANLLSLRLTAKHVVPLFAATESSAGTGAGALRRALDEALVALRPAAAFESFSSAEAMQDALEPLARANRATRSVRGWTPVTVSKVLHRHAPQVVPIVDSRVRDFYSVAKGQEHELRARMWTDIRANIGWLRSVAAEHRTPDGRPVSVLRAADILIWSAG